MLSDFHDDIDWHLNMVLYRSRLPSVFLIFLAIVAYSIGPLGPLRMPQCLSGELGV